MRFHAPSNCKLSQEAHIYAVVFDRHSPSMRTKATVQRWGACDGLRIIFCRSLPLLALLCLLLPTHPAHCGDKVIQEKNILILGSYHAGLRWDDGIKRALTEQLKPVENKLDLHFEYMDTKRIADATYAAKLYDLYLYKYRNTRFDLIISSDNFALNFLLQHRNKLFGKVPVVFCGVNNFKDEILEGKQLYTGAAEQFNAVRAFDIIRKLHPNLKEIFVLNDNDVTGKAWAATIREQTQAQYPEIRVRYSLPMTEAEALGYVSTLPKNTVVLLGVFLRDKAGRYVPPQYFSGTLPAASPVPVYTFLELYMGYGIVGGDLIDGYHQGVLAAGLAQKILAGQSPETIPVLKQGMTRPMFDYNAMNRFGIKESDLPESSIILNRQLTFYQEHKGKVFAATAFFLVESLLICLLILALMARRKAEAALLHSQKRLNMTLEAVNEGVWDWNMTDNSTFFSPRYYSMLGFEPYEFPQTFESFRKSVHPDDIDRVEQKINEHKDGSRYEVELRMQTKSGHWRWILSRGMVVEHDLSGAPVRMLGTHADMTKRKEDEFKLKESEEKYRALVETMGEGLVTIDPKNKITYTNPQFATMIGISREALTGKELADLLTRESKTVFYQLVEQQTDVGSKRYELQWHKADGTILSTLVMPQPLFDKEGNFIGSFAAISDITEIKQAQQELIHYRDHLEELVSERTTQLAVAKEKAEKANRAKSLFLANMSHELRSPLNVILGFSQLMRRTGSLPPQQQEQLETINHSGEHLLSLINDILEISRIETRRVQIKKAPCDFTTLLRELETMLSVKAEAKGLPMTITGLENIPRFLITDAGKIRQILINLIDNAIKFTEEGFVAVRATCLPESEKDFVLQLDVEDTGYGIAEKEMDMVFSYFDQSESGRLSQAGTGLGLAISREYARMLGGDITVKSSLGSGSTFRFLLPVTACDEEEVFNRTPSRKVIGLAADSLVPRILVAEDKQDSRRLLVNLLETTGFEVREAANGQEAITEFTRWHPHFIWMDIRMPVMNGLEATERIRELDDHDNRVTIVALTAHAFDEERDPILAAGCDDLASKPFREEDIFRIMGEHLGITYKYELTAEMEGVAKQQAHRPIDLTRLSLSQREDLHDAILHLDAQRILGLIENIDDIIIKEALLARADQMDYQSILECIEDIAGNEGTSNQAHDL